MTLTQNQKSIRQATYAGLGFGVCMGLLIFWLTGSASYAVRGGFLCGFAFGLMLVGFLKVAMTTSRLEIDGREAGFDADEKVRHFGPANHFKGLESVGGKLFLTDRRLRFRSHKFNVQCHDESYPLEAIASAEPARTLGIVPNAVLVHFRDGRKERFVVGGRAEWVAHLLQAIGTAG